MIQRVQSIYLLIIIILFVQMFMFPIVKFSGKELIVLYAIKISNGETTYPLAILLGIIPLIVLVTLFFYKKRILQIRLTVINILLMIGSLALIFFYVYQIIKSGDFKAHYQFLCLYPVISIILAYLAIRAIGRDEALIRSIDRIR